jgi:putative ABC transport system ATP-binding protein
MSKKVEVKNLSRVFRHDSSDITVLKEVNLSIEPGEFLALVGPSGSGKTTLLNILSGIDKPTSGSVRTGDHEIQQMSEDQLADWRNVNVGFVFQTFNLIPVLTAAENVELPLLLTGLSKQERREHVNTAINLVGLSDRASHYPKQLSGGQQQRVAIARAVVTDPELILADEPTGNLDAESAEEVLLLLRRLNEDLAKTIIMVTHDTRALSYVRRMQRLDKGSLLEAEIGYAAERGL